MSLQRDETYGHAHGRHGTCRTAAPLRPLRRETVDGPVRHRVDRSYPSGYVGRQDSRCQRHQPLAPDPSSDYDGCCSINTARHQANRKPVQQARRTRQRTRDGTECGLEYYGCHRHSGCGCRSRSEVHELGETVLGRPHLRARHDSDGNPGPLGG